VNMQECMARTLWSHLKHFVFCLSTNRKWDFGIYTPQHRRFWWTSSRNATNFNVSLWFDPAEK